MAGRFEFRILGPTEIWRDGTMVRFRGRRELTLVALLAIEANRVVATERLVEDLWGEAAPAGAVRSLRVYVSRIRQALGDDGGLLVTRPGGYLLRAGAETIDAARFETEVQRGRLQAAAGNHTGAGATFREALALWRGPALVDVAPDIPSAASEAARLEEARLVTLEERLEADLACGRHGEVTAELDVLTRAHPFRERLWAQRITALYRAGRQADALRAYQDLRRSLRDELGIEPSSALQQLEGFVLRHDPELDWHPGGAVDRPGIAEAGALPQPLHRVERLPLVGREIELSGLAQAWEAARSGRRHLVLLAGEPGIGKSRLSADFAGAAHDRGALVLFGRCDEGMGVPYQPFVEALGRYLRQPRDLVLGRLAGELVRLVPEIGERVEGLAPPIRSDPETERYRLFGAVAAWLAALSESVPVTFVIEDLHWATKPTLLLLSHLLRSDEDLRLLLVVTFRDTPLDMTAELADLVAELLRLPGVERIRLAGLDESGVGTLMEAQAEHKLDEEGWALARIVHGETAGNPFYVREMLRHLAEKGDLIRRDGRWVPGPPLAQLDVPDSVRDVVERRLTRLPDHTSEMLALAAVLGERFDLPLLAQASGESESSVIQALRPAVSARLVNETDAGSYHFTHALVRSTLEEALGPTRGVQLHRVAGFAVEAVHAGHLDAHLPQLAHHFARAREVQKAIEYASRAGDRALAQLAHDEAAMYYASALELLDAAGVDGADHRRLELLLDRGEAERRAGNASFRQTLLDAAHLAIRLGDHSALAGAALANGRGSIYSTSFAIDTARVAVLEAAIERLGSQDLALRARLLANLGLELCWERDARRRIALSDEAVRLARQLADPSTLAVVLLARDYTIHEPDNTADRFRATTELLTLADELPDPVVTSRALALRFKASAELADIAEAERSLVRNEAVVAELGQPALTWVVMVQRAGLALLRGDLSLAETTADAAYEHAVRTGQPDALYWFLPQHMQVRVEQARAAEIEEIVRCAAEKHNSPGVTAMYGGFLLEAGRPDGASEVFEELANTNFAAPRPSSLWLRFAAECAVMCARLGRPAAVPQLRAMLEPYADQLVTTSQGGAITGNVSYYLGLLATTIGDWPQAEAFFTAAEATHERIGAPAWRARTRLERARMLLTRRQPGDAERARQLLEPALATAKGLGLASIEQQSIGLLEECR